MADKNIFTKQELNTLVATSLVEVKEIKTGVDEIKKEIILDKESRIKWLSEIRNEVRLLINSKENTGSTNETFNLESKDIQTLIDDLSLKIYGRMCKNAEEHNRKNREMGRISGNEYLQKIYDQQSEHIDQYNKDRELWLSYNTKKENDATGKFGNLIIKLKDKISAFYKEKLLLWIRNPYKATALLLFGIYFCLSCFSWIRWHDYRSENLRLQQIEAKYEVDKAIIQELNPKLSITLSGYEKLTDQLGKEETIGFFNDGINDLKTKSNK